MVYNHLTLACQAVIYQVCNPLFNNIKYKVFSKNTISQAYFNLLKSTETAPPLLHALICKIVFTDNMVTKLCLQTIW